MILLISVVSEQPAHWLNSVRRFSPLPAPPLHLHPCLSPWLSRHIHTYIRASKGTLILGIWELIAIYTTAAVTGIALQTSIKTQNFIQNWIKDAHTMRAAQAQIDEEIQDEI